MSTSITAAFITQYERDVHDIFQRQGSVLKPTVRFRTGVKGSSAVFQKIAKGAATTKARHGTITPMNQTHTSHTATLEDFYAGDWVDRLDEAKINIEERRAIARGGAWALGRKVDDQILTLLDSTTQTTVTMTTTSYANVRNHFIKLVGDLMRLDSYEPGMMYGVVSPVTWERMAGIPEFASSDYVDASGRPFTSSAPYLTFKKWLNVVWTVHSGIPGIGTSASKHFVWNKNSLAYASGAHPANLAARGANESGVGADITWHGDRAAHFINHAMSGGGVVIDDTGIIEGQTNDTLALATT